MKARPLQMKPLLLSKLTTFFQISLLLATLADLGFALDVLWVRDVLAITAGVLTIASWVAYYFEGTAAVRADD
jgi:cardiolipin synthase